MSTTLTAMRGKLNLLIGDIPVTGTTTSAGAADFTTFVDTALAKYDEEDYFQGWEAYIALTTPEAQTVKTFLPASGTCTVYTAYAAQVAKSKTYAMCRFPMAHKKSALNRALNDVYPTFFARQISKTLWGQSSYGVSPEEFDKFTYTVPAAFVEFPSEIWVTSAYTGEHTGADGAATLTDSSADWANDELIGLTLFNKTDGSLGTVTGNDSTTVTATLTGGTDTDWDEGDEYIIVKPTASPERFTNYKGLPADEDSWYFYASIPETKLVTLIGKGRLTQFGVETSTTELTDAQSEMVALKAAAMFYQFYAGSVDSVDSERFELWSNKYHSMYDYSIRQISKPEEKIMKLDWSYLG